MMASQGDLPQANPMIVFREEYDDWAVLFDPDTNEAFGLDPVGVFIWKKLDGKTSRDDILTALAKSCDGGIPESAPKDLDEFLTELADRGLIGCKC